MTAWIDAFLPTFGLIALGVFLRRRLLRDDAFWAGLDLLTFWVLLPSLLAVSISTVKLAELPLGRLATSIWTALGLATLAALVLARAFRANRPAMTSIVQGGIRFNSYMALAITAGLYGPAGLALASVVAGLIVPTVQTILTVIFVVSENRRVSLPRMLAQIVTNPLLIGCFVGFGFSLAGGMPPGLLPFARSLGQASLAIGLLCVGAGLTLASLREAPRLQLAVGLQKLCAVPAVTLAIATWVGLDARPALVAVLVMAMPTAPSAYVMARALGGDARLMAAMVTIQHLAALVTLPIWALLLA